MCDYINILPALNLKVITHISFHDTIHESYSLPFSVLSYFVELKDFDLSTYIIGQAFIITYSQHFGQDQSQHVD